jgi:outer membrane protein OmpA-like peptidoglycan-associated protein
VAFFLALASTRVAAEGVLAEDKPDGEAPGGAFRLTERSDFSRYVDGRYLGHVYRESRGALRPATEAGAGSYEGEFLVLEETLHDARDAARRVDRTAPARLSLTRGGSIEVLEDSGYPSLRGIPSFPEGSHPGRIDELEPGATWTSAGSRALDFDGPGSFVVLPFLAEYRYLGRSEYRGRRALGLSAKFATRWKAGTASDRIRGAMGTHDLEILVDAETLSTLFIRDHFDETFDLADGGAGSSERRSGFCLYFFEGAVPVDRKAAGEAMTAAAEAAKPMRGPDSGPGLPPGAGPGKLDAGEGTPLADGGEFAAAGLELDSSPEGMVLRVKDLRFVADGDAILPSELWRLDAIAAALKALPNRSFLVAGHSAAVGKVAGELELSIERAKRVTAELVARGIEASRLLYQGFGSARPLASNDSEEGRAKNRRVEITILD